MWRAVLGRASAVREWVRWASSASEQRLRRLEACRALGVAPGAPPDAVRRAYYRLAKRCHPDVAGPAATGRFLQVQSAYETLRQHHHHQQQQAAAASAPQAEAAAWRGVTFDHGLRRRVLVRRQGGGGGDGACAASGGHPLWALLNIISRFLRRPRC